MQIFPFFHNLAIFPVFSEIATFVINLVCNHTRDKQLGRPRNPAARSSDFVIIRVIDRIGLRYVLLPSLNKS